MTTVDGATVLDKNNVPASDFVFNRKALPEKVRTLLLHTRFATQGEPNIWGNNHPVFFGSTFTVHNGTIYNDDKLFEEHKLTRIAQVDSEIIPALLDKYGFDAADKAFGELRGGFATASIDAVRNPGTLILAKGGQWPLVVLEAKDFIVFASTKTAIVDAWGATLGTPPTRGFDELGEGDIWYVNKDVIDKHKKAFDPAPWKITSKRSSQQSSFTGGWTPEDDDEYYEYWPMSGNARGYLERSSRSSTKQPEPRTKLDNVALMAGLRKTGKTACVTFSERELPHAKKYLEKYGNAQWSYCVHCATSVADTQVMKGTREWGNICVDCFTVAKSLSKNDEGSDVLAEFLIEVGMRTDDYDSLEKFADLQAYIHNQSLYALSRETGIKRTSIEWLLFRADPLYLEGDKSVQDLYCNLNDRYMDTIAEIWQAWAIEGDDAEDDIPSDPYISCGAGTHRESVADQCAACIAASAPCGVEAFAEEDKGVVIAEVNLLPTKCLLCRKKPKHYLGLTHAWCAGHFNVCGTRGCKAQAVGYLPNNQRRCHGHSRQQKGFIADGDFAARKRAAGLVSA